MFNDFKCREMGWTLEMPGKTELTQGIDGENSESTRDAESPALCGFLLVLRCLVDLKRVARHLMEGMCHSRPLIGIPFSSWEDVHPTSIPKGFKRNVSTLLYPYHFERLESGTRLNCYGCGILRRSLVLIQPGSPLLLPGHYNHRQDIARQDVLFFKRLPFVPWRKVLAPSRWRSAGCWKPLREKNNSYYQHRYRTDILAYAFNIDMI